MSAGTIRGEKHDVRIKSQNPLDPDRVVTTDTFISAYGTRATLFEWRNSNPRILTFWCFCLTWFSAELAIARLTSLTNWSERALAAAQVGRGDPEGFRHGIGDENQHL